MRDRSWRRSQREVAIARAKRDMLSWDSWYRDDPEGFEVAARRNARTPHPCSRLCCGNPRKWCDGFERLPLAEHRANLSAAEQLTDCYSGQDQANDDHESYNDAVAEDDRGRN